MKHLLLPITILAAVFTGCASDSESLFNGKDLTGWSGTPGGRWYVENGCLVTENSDSKEYEYLATDRIFKDFDLELEFKQIADGNSGIFFHTYKETVENGAMSWQCEVAPKDKYSGGIYESYGRGWIAQPEGEDPLKVGKWNKMRLRVNGSHVTTWLNGRQMVDIDEPLIAAGQGCILLQLHSGEDVKILWRNIRIKELPETPHFEGDPVPEVPTERICLFNGKDFDGWDIWMDENRPNEGIEQLFTVKDGAIHVSGKGMGGVTTKRAFKDYKLTVRYRFVGEGYDWAVDKTADGGVLFHCVGPEGMYSNTWHFSFEYNMIVGATGDMIMVMNSAKYPAVLSAKGCADGTEFNRWDPDGKVQFNEMVSDRGGKVRINWKYLPDDWEYTTTQPAVWPERTYGEWNDLTLICRGHEADFYLNGEQVNHVFDLYPCGGRIQLQSEDHGIEYKDIYIEPLDWEAFPEEEEGFEPLDLNEEYEDFVFRFDYRFTKRGANNGVGIRTPLEGTPAFVGMCECQILDNDAEEYWPELIDWQRHGSAYGIVPAELTGQNPFGEWNSEEIEVKGSRVKVTLNGHVILDADIEEAIGPDGQTIDGKAHPGIHNKKGHICFCDHGDGFEYRNARVKKL